MKINSQLILAALVAVVLSPVVLAQSDKYRKEIRGYKVERTTVEIKQSETGASRKNRNAVTTGDSEVDQLITFGAPQLARVTPLGITFAVPIVVAAVKQTGRVDFLSFEDMAVNGHSVEIEDYQHQFNLPNKDPLTLKEPLRFYIYLPTAMLAAADEWKDSKETWSVSGRVYVFGKFKKALFSFKRCIPVELNLTMNNPLRH